MTLDRYGSHYQLRRFLARIFPCRGKLVAAIREAFGPEFSLSKFRLDRTDIPSKRRSWKWKPEMPRTLPLRSGATAF